MSYLLDAIWEYYVYQLFGFLLIVFFMMIIASVEVAVVSTYLQLCQ